MAHTQGDETRIYEFSTGDLTAAEFQQQLDAIKPTVGAPMLPAVEQLMEILPKGEDWYEVSRNHELHTALTATLEHFKAMELAYGDAMMEPSIDDQKASAALSVMEGILEKPLLRTVSRDGEIRYSRDPVAEIRDAINEYDHSFENPLPDASERAIEPANKWSGDRIVKGRDRTLKIFRDEKGSSGPEVA